MTARFPVRGTACLDVTAANLALDGKDAVSTNVQPAVGLAGYLLSARQNAFRVLRICQSRGGNCPRDVIPPY